VSDQESDEYEICYARLVTADHCVQEFRVDRHEHRPKIETAIAPMVSRTYLFTRQFMAYPIFNNPFRKEKACMIKEYREHVPRGQEII
jgi:hypothetical protein